MMYVSVFPILSAIPSFFTSPNNMGSAWGLGLIKEQFSLLLLLASNAEMYCILMLSGHSDQVQWNLAQTMYESKLAVFVL